MNNEDLLVAAFRGGDKQAGEKLLSGYKGKVRSVARRYYLVGGDLEDLVQEGMLGLYSAMNSFTGESGFSAYAYACIKNRIVDAVKKYGSLKNSALNGSSPISEANGEATLFSPEDALIISEDLSETEHLLKSILSPLEYEAIRLYVEGASMTEITKALDLTYKQADNALARAKSKLKKRLLIN